MIFVLVQPAVEGVEVRTSGGAGGLVVVLGFAVTRGSVVDGVSCLSAVSVLVCLWRA